MRLSGNNKDPGFHPAFMHRCLVLFNGRIIRRVITADEELGYVWHYKTDENNKHIIINGHALREWLVGDVQIVLPCTEITVDFVELALDYFYIKGKSLKRFARLRET